MTERKPVYCDCPKKPGGILEVDSLTSRIHADCGKRIGPFPPERKPVFCAHQDIRFNYEIPATLTCGLCRRVWKDDEDQPVAIIGYVEGK